MKKIFALFAILVLLTSFVIAEDAEPVLYDDTPEPELIDAEPELFEDDTEAGITPDSIFYGLDRAMERISLALTFNKAKKAEKGLKYANERLMEVKQMIEENKLEHAEKAQEEHGKTMEAAEDALGDVEDPEDVEQLKNQVQSHYEKVVQVKNIIMERQRERMNEEQIAHMEEVFGKIMTKAQEMETKVEQKKEEVGKPEDAGKPDDDTAEGKKPEDKGKDDTGDQDEEEAEGEGELDLLVSDMPADIGDFDSLIVTFNEVKLFKGEKPVRKEIDEVSVDLTQLQGEKAFEVLSTELDAGTYSKVEMYVSSVEAEAEGSNVIVKVPSNKLMITKKFEIKDGETTKFVFDIHVVKTGQGYNLLPLIGKSGVAGDDVDVEEVECSLDADCGDLELCLENECESVDCIEDSDCEEGDYCENNECIDIPECTTDEECTDGYCEENECVAYDCMENADCEAGYACTENECEEVTECVANEDCNGLFCLDTTCSEDECTDDAHCEEGYLCEETLCVEEPECTLDEECAEGYECIEEVCTEIIEEETPCDPVCTEGFVCTEGSCIEATV